MINSVYQNHKGINQTIEFRGLKAQYIWYLGGGIVILLILFAGMYILGLPPLICAGIILALGVFLVVKVYKMSKAYGEYGLMKKLAQRQIPKVIKSHSRSIFYKQKRQKG
ncbi:DUF4133 domain-containing protein [Sinomicrobium weinanense]|uniref:DUF4133 domain-containing protein n=1 Tax=Sinomicrobium weinanense TaxID=2842200 RepID=A0A926Q448_9FLAO|nr:DUF4133 domain-containing protein [Sinomicrobium weinanense]MBC9797589.1 DUF4133 domain-containing protein [Sinomicrobium weinanense]MBU3123656.1 DUF4133 domain-containing protein [Sinomicrobium weinanense]